MITLLAASLSSFLAWAAPAALAAEPEGPPPGPAHDAWERGIAALGDKDAAGARAAFEQCLAVAPAELSCRWELGWAAWIADDWAGVVAAWEAVAAADPTYATVAKQLPVARANLETAAAAARAREGAPATVPRPTGALAPVIRLRFVGDMMIGSAFPEGVLPPDDGAGAFAEVAALLRDADATIGNLEGPLCDTDEPSDKCKEGAAPGSCYAFRSPVRYAPYYKDAGFDALSTANNHAGDFGDACRLQTEAALDAQGIRWSGRPGTTAEWEVGGRKIGFVAFHTNMACNYLNDPAGVAALVGEVASRTDFVIVMFHGGAEGSKALHVPVGGETFYGEDRGDLRAFARGAIDAGADVVVGAGPHVLRGMETYRDRLVAYSLGNFATYGRFNLSGNMGLGAILEVELAADGRFSAGRILGTRQVGEGLVRPDPANAAADLVRSLTLADFAATGVRIGRDGTIGPAGR